MVTITFMVTKNSARIFPCIPDCRFKRYCGNSAMFDTFRRNATTATEEMEVTLHAHCVFSQRYVYCYDLFMFTIGQGSADRHEYGVYGGEPRYRHTIGRSS